MNAHRQVLPVASAIAVAGLLVASPAQAQSLVSTNGQILAANGMQAAGMPAGVVYGGTGTFDSSVVDENGNVLFRGRLQDPGAVVNPPLSLQNDRAYFHGPDLANLSLLRRSGDPAPTFAGLTLNIGTTVPTGIGISGSPRLTPNGQLFYGAGICGTGVLTSDDTVIYGGPIGSEQVVVREGASAPTGGATLTQAWNGMSYQSVGMSRTGRFVFKSTLAGGDTVGATNNDGVFTGTLGGPLEWVIRKGDTLPGGEVIAATGGFLQQINDSGQILHDAGLSTTLGTTPATAADDRILFIYTPGLGNTAIVREGDAAPGTAGATFNIASNSWFHNVPPCAFTQNGEFMMHADLLNGDVVPGVNDRAVYIGSTSGLTLALRRGDAAPGTDGTFNSWNNSNSGMSTSGRITIGGTISGGTTTVADNSGIWSGTPGNLQLVVREGDILPGTVDVAMVGSFNATDSGFGSRTIIANDVGQVLFATDLVGGDSQPGINDIATCIWDPQLGLRVLARRGDQVETLPGVFKTVNLAGSVQFNNGDNVPLSFGNGVLACNLSFMDGTSAVVKVTIPSQPGNAFCSGDGTGAACPCANDGLPGHGCASSLSADGGRLVASGIASLASDSIVLQGSSMPNSSALYFQGTVQQSGGAGVAFGDGLRCAGGTITRLGTQSNSGGASQYPAAGDPSVSVRGLVTAPGIRTYQVWYRNAASFCTADTFNLTNGWELTWAP